MNRSDVFISYRRKDKEFTRQLDQALKREGLEVWVDWEDIPPGSTDFIEDIRVGIEGADVFLAVMSPAYLESTYTMGELQLAVENHKRIVPIVHKKFDHISIPKEIGHINWVYFTPHVGEENTFDEAFPVLMEAILADQEYTAAHTRYLLRAREWEKYNRNASYLLNGTEINKAEQWLATAGEKTPSPLTLHSEYIFASRARQRQIQRTLLFGVTLIMLISVVLAIFSYRQLQISQELSVSLDREKQQAESLLWATYALERVGLNDTLLAIPLALEANKIENPPALSQQALAAAAYEPGPRQLYRLEDTRIWSASYNPNETQVATGDSSGRITVWSTETGTIVWQQSEAHAGSVWQVVYHPENSIIASTGADSRVRLWNAQTGDPIGELSGHDDITQWSLDFDPRGRFLAGGGVDGMVRVWEYNNQALVATIDSENREVWTVRYSPGGAYLGAAGSDGIAIAWDGRTLDEYRRFTGHSGDVWSMDFSPDNQTVVTGGGDGIIRTWDLNSGARINQYRDHTDRVLAVRYSSDGERFLSAGADQSIILWNARRVQEITRYQGHSDSVWSIDLSQFSEQFVSSAADGTAILWDIEGGAAITNFQPGHDGDILALAISPDGQTIATGDDERTIIRQSPRGSQILYFDREHTGSVNDLAFSPDGRQLVSAGDSRLLMWDILTGNLLEIFTGHDRKVQTVAFFPDGQRLVSGSSDNTLIIWDVESGAAIGEPLRAHSATILDVDVSSDGQLIASSGGDRKVLVWDAETQANIFAFDDHEDVTRKVAFSPNGEWLASGGDDRVVILHNLQTGTMREFTGHNGAVTALAFSPEGNFIMSGGSDHLVIMWDLEGNQLRRYDLHTQPVTEIVFDPTDSTRVISTGLDGQVIVWRADDLEELRAWTVENRGIREFTCLERDLFQLPDSEGCQHHSSEETGSPSTEIAPTTMPEADESQPAVATEQP